MKQKPSLLMLSFSWSLIIALLMTAISFMNLPGWKLHPLSADLTGHWAVWVSGNWRLTFVFEGEDAVLVDYQDYH